MILVKIYWNTEADGTPVPPPGLPGDPGEDGPISYVGPFTDMDDANSWMENDYPEDDTDVRDMLADDFDLPAGTYVNPRNFMEEE